MISKLTPVAKKLRNNLTDAEKYLWYLLRGNNLGVRFRRQVIVGSYIVDFICFDKKLVVELDGGQHAGLTKDIERDQWLEKEGYRVLRFWNNDVLANRDGVLTEIIKFL